jgi:hypothetical protein
VRAPSRAYLSRVAEPALLFIDPDPVVETLKQDLAWPWRLDSRNDVVTVSGVANLEAALEHRAITDVGEIGHRPEYGIDWDDMHAAPNVEGTWATLEARLLDQYERELRVENVKVDVDDDPATPGDVIARVNGFASTGQSASTDIAVAGAGRS